MVRIGHIPTVLGAVFAILSVPLLAQSSPEQTPSAPVKSRAIPPPVQPVPFPVGASGATSIPSIEFQPTEQMSQSDRLLTSNDESSIAEHAATNGFDLSQGKWSYEQIVCPALPNHLFLRYMQNNGVGDLTVFSASIPRNGEGRVRIIPIQKRSYSLFSPAPINALTISAFNHIRGEEGEGQSSSWLGNALCYAALAGAQPQLAPTGEEAQPGKIAPPMTAILSVPAKGGEVIKFIDAAATPRPMEWTMTFSSKGKLMKASRAPAPGIATRPIPVNSPAPTTKSIPQSDSH